MKKIFCLKLDFRIIVTRHDVCEQPLAHDEDGKDKVMEEEEEKEKKPRKCLEGSNGYFIYKNMAENWCGSSPECGECTVEMEQ